MGCGPSSDSESANPKKKSGRKFGFFNKKSSSNILQVASFDVNEKTLSTFLQLEKDIAEAESQNPLKPLDLKADQLLQLSEKRRELERKLVALEEEANLSAENHNDETETRKFLMQKGTNNELSPDQEKHLDLLNEKEIVSKELQTTARQYKEVSKEVRELERKTENLQTLYKKQDKMLDQLFGGEYGSIRENQLENELDHLEVQRGRILEANFKWRQGQMMLEYACKQLGIAVRKWRDIPNLSTDDMNKRYSLATEVRNNVVAAAQNIAGAQRYLNKVEFPYCNEKEVATLHKAVQYIFTDMQTEDRHDHANQCYTVAHKRCNALLQWFDAVINSTIMKDLHEINERVKTKAFELRRERVRLIRAKVKEVYGYDIKLNENLRGRDVTTEELAGALLNDNQVVKVDDGDRSTLGIATPCLLGDDELAPVPSNSTIFGKNYDAYKEKIDQLTQEHQEQLQACMKEQELMQIKIRGSLEEKLMQRRKRRARIRMEETQRDSLKRY